MNTQFFKTIIGKFALICLLACSFSTQAKAESTVYFFVDFRFWNPEMTFTLNGEEAFKLKGEEQYIGKTKFYSMMMRKVVFTNPNSYVVATDAPAPDGKVYHAELNMNLEDGETYYVILNASLKKTFYMELLPEKEGMKLLKKAQTNKKYHINEPFTYDK